MARTYIFGTILLVIVVVMAMAGCEKEKIVETTEYIHDVEYVELPSDTIYQVDSVFIHDSIMVNVTDTILRHDTIIQVNYIYDTVTTVEYYYDTTVVADTVMISQCEPNEYLAIAALQYYSDPLVIDFIYQEFGYNDGWIFYLSSFQLELTSSSSEVYDIYGYIDYWTPDWSGYYPLEFYWRMIHKGGDPADPHNWEMSEPMKASIEHKPGLRLTSDERLGQRTLR